MQVRLRHAKGQDGTLPCAPDTPMSVGSMTPMVVDYGKSEEHLGRLSARDAFGYTGYVATLDEFPKLRRAGSACFTVGLRDLRVAQYSPTYRPEQYTPSGAIRPQELRSRKAGSTAAAAAQQEAQANYHDCGGRTDTGNGGCKLTRVVHIPADSTFSTSEHPDLAPSRGFWHDVGTQSFSSSCDTGFDFSWLELDSAASSMDLEVTAEQAAIYKHLDDDKQLSAETFLLPWDMN